MGTITTDVGLFSGLDIRGIVDGLMAIERRPSQLLQQSIDRNTSIQTSIQALSLSIVGVNLAADALGAGQAFVQRTASSSSDALSVTAGPKAAIGSFAFTPRQLVSTHQTLSDGFSDTTELVGAGTLSIAQGGFVDRETSLSLLNGGAGVAAGSIRITDRSGIAATVDLTAARTADEVVDAINASSGIGVSASVSGDSFVLTDTTGGGLDLRVEEVSGGTTATDLGIAGNVAANVLTGSDVLNLASDLRLSQLNDGNGVRAETGLNDFNISVDGGALAFDINIDSATTVGDVVNLINDDATNGGRVVASLTDNGFRLTDTLASADVTVTASNGSLAADDLGILGAGSSGVLTGSAALGGLNTVLLDSLRGGFNGGADLALTTGTINLKRAASGADNLIDLSGAETLDDVAAGINAAGAGVTASINRARNGIELTVDDPGGDPFGGFIEVADVSGNVAQFLKLDSLNGGAGVPTGKLRITDGFGATSVIDLTQADDDNIGEVLNEINAVGLSITARINDAGDGIVIEQNGGSATLQVENDGNAKTAEGLNIAGVAQGGQIDGSFKFEVDVTATDTLEDVVDKLLASGAPIQVSILDDGSGQNPFRLSVTSTTAGTAGELLIDAGATSLRFSDVSRPKDAVLIFGGGGGAVPVQLASDSNSFSNVVPGVDVDLNRVATEPVTITVTQDEAGIVDRVRSFIDAFNSVKSFIADTAGFDPETEQRGLLFTEQSVRSVESLLNNFVNSRFTDTGSSITTLGGVGIGFDGAGQLEFDESAFLDAFRATPSDVESFFIVEDNGFSDRFGALNDSLTSFDGLLSDRSQTLTSTLERQSASLERLNDRLDTRRTRLQNEFFTLEVTLAGLQSQQNSLNQLAQLATLANASRT